MLEQIRSDKKQLVEKIKDLLNEFEVKYGQDIITDIKVSRWNGSNAAWGKISDIFISIRI